ncbi:MAG: glycosyltransferase [Isosphaeraceae bacterium]
MSLSFVVCLSDEGMLKANLLTSPCFGPGSHHEVIAVRDAPSAADGLAMGCARATHELTVCVHQDVFLPRGWDRLMVRQFHMAQQQFGPIGVAGVYGVGEVMTSNIPCRLLSTNRIGWVVDRGRLLSEGPGLPAPVTTLDELLLIVPRNTPLRFDPALGFHLYGADLCLQARERGLAVVALGAPCHHNSRTVGLPVAFLASASVFARKWAARLPVATPCVVFDRDGHVHLLRDSIPDGSSLAFAEDRALDQRAIEPRIIADQAGSENARRDSRLRIADYGYRIRDSGFQVPDREQR